MDNPVVWDVSFSNASCGLGRRMCGSRQTLAVRVAKQLDHILIKKQALSLFCIGFAAISFSASAGPASLVVRDAGPLTLPRMGEAGALDLAAERQLGERIAQQIFRDPDFLDDPLLDDYLQAIWQPLLASARARGDVAPELAERFAWRLMLSREASVNAFALPGGYLGVHLGLLATVTTADELASVLAHELTHVSQRHISRMIERQDKQAPWMVAAMILGALAASASKNTDVVQAAVVGGQAVAAQTQLNFSRDMEREADRVGYNVMTGAGFDGNGFVTMFHKLEKASRLNDDGAFPYLRSHPLTTERMADMQSRVKHESPAALQGGAVAPVSAQWHALMSARARVLSEPSLARWRAWLADTQAPAPSAAVWYAGALSALRLKQPADAWRCVQALWQQMPTMDAAAAQATRLLALEVWLAPGAASAMPGAAWPNQLLGHARQALLGAQGRASVVLGAQTLLAQGQSAEVVGPLQLWLSSHPADAMVWLVLAQAWQAQGHPLRAIRAEAEARVAQFDLGGAIDRLSAARELGRELGRTQRDADHMELSIIDTRYRQLVQQQRERLQENRR